MGTAFEDGLCCFFQRRLAPSRNNQTRLIQGLARLAHDPNRTFPNELASTILVVLASLQLCLQGRLQTGFTSVRWLRPLLTCLLLR